MTNKDLNRYEDLLLRTESLSYEEIDEKESLKAKLEGELEKAEDYPELVEENVKYFEEIRQLKKDNNAMRNYNRTMTESLREEIQKNGGLKQTLEKIKEWANVNQVKSGWNGEDIVSKIKEILKKN